MAMVFVLLTYGGWNEAAYISAELKDQKRNMVRALVYSILLITALYLLVTWAYWYGLGLAGLAASDAIAAALMRRVESDLEANRYDNALRRKDVLLDSLDTSRLLLGSQVHVQEDTTPQGGKKLKEDISDAMKGELVTIRIITRPIDAKIAIDGDELSFQMVIDAPSMSDEGSDASAVARGCISVTFLSGITDPIWHRLDGRG